MTDREWWELRERTDRAAAAYIDALLRELIELLAGLERREAP